MGPGKAKQPLHHLAAGQGHARQPVAGSAALGRRGGRALLLSVCARRALPACTGLPLAAGPGGDAAADSPEEPQARLVALLDAGEQELPEEGHVRECKPGPAHQEAGHLHVEEMLLLEEHRDTRAQHRRHGPGQSVGHATLWRRLDRIAEHSQQEDDLWQFLERHPLACLICRHGPRLRPEATDGQHHCKRLVRTRADHRVGAGTGQQQQFQHAARGHDAQQGRERAPRFHVSVLDPQGAKLAGQEW
mmetsp:Transcript_58757/g.184434  ORF Transcript_58757/g.184434 Transcript_58757/m.184434 type:complete len:247 (-) Transcript_58757:541-1281(-)